MEEDLMDEVDLNEGDDLIDIDLGGGQSEVINNTTDTIEQQLLRAQEENKTALLKAEELQKLLNSKEEEVQLFYLL
jgi:hypothetical protein